MFETCDKGSSAPNTVLDAIPYSQEGSGRHQCAVCAYQRGRADAQAGISPPPPGCGERCQHGSIVPDNLFNDLHHNQGGRGRHKCVCCAYREGYTSGTS